MGQSFTINSSQQKTLIIGKDNLLEIKGYPRIDSLNLEASSGVRCKKKNENVFILTATKPRKEIPIILKNGNEIVDTIIVSSERIWLKQFIKTDSFGFIKSGEHSIEIIKSIVSIEVRCNIPNKREIPVQNYRIEIYQKNDLVLSKTFRGKKFNHPEIINALNQLKKNDIIEIKRIKARTPWDDGQQPMSMFLKVK